MITDKLKLTRIYNHFNYIINNYINNNLSDIIIDNLEEYLIFLNEKFNIKYDIQVMKSDNILNLTFHSIIFNSNEYDIIHFISFFIKKLENNNIELVIMPSLIKIFKFKFKRQELSLDETPTRKIIKL
jgi:predicted ATP-grasp superfamily ATP-dependent carboligase